jgi:hypothetical protein
MEHVGLLLCSCFFLYSYSASRYSYSCSKRPSITIRPIDPQVPANRLDQRSAVPQFKQPSSMSTTSLSTSTTKSDARHENIVHWVYHNLTQPKLTIRRVRSQADPNPKTPLSKSLPQQSPMRRGQDILNWSSLGYMEFCFFWLYVARIDTEPDSLVAVMQSKLINEVRRIACTLHVAKQLRRHHINENSVQAAVKSAVNRTGICKKISCHTFRHSFATHPLESGKEPGLSSNCSVSVQAPWVDLLKLRLADSPRFC